MEIKNLNKEGLANLKQEIEDRLKIIEIKEVEIEKESISSLENGDKIFGIRLSFGGHRLEEPDELNGAVDIIDYCIVTDVNLRGESDDFRITISHPTEALGVSASLSKKDYESEYCYLNLNTFKTGYDSFFTLKPKTWKDDLIRMLNKDIEDRKKYFQRALDLLNSKVNLFIDSEEKINEYL